MKILVVLSRFPYPIEKGDKLRAYHQIKGLAKKNEVHLVCLNAEKPPLKDLEEIRKYCESIEVIEHPRARVLINLMKGLLNTYPFQVNYFRSPNLKKKLESLIDKEGFDVVFVQLVRMGLNIPFRNGPGYFLDFMDAFSKGMENRIDLTSGLEKPLVRAEYKRLRRFENEFGKKFHGWSMISRADVEALQGNWMDKVTVIPNGVSEAFFEEGETVEKDIDILFTGNMGYHPNVEAAKFLVEKILPAMGEDGKSLRICLAGARPAPEIKALASEQVEVTGFVVDLRDYLCRAKLFVAPLINGSGLQNKLLESMAMGIPTITSQLANEALKAEPEKQIVVCQDEKEFANRISELLANKGYRIQIAKAGKEYVASNFRWKAQNELLEKALLDAVEKGKA